MDENDILRLSIFVLENYLLNLKSYTGFHRAWFDSNKRFFLISVEATVT